MFIKPGLEYGEVETMVKSIIKEHAKKNPNTPLETILPEIIATVIARNNDALFKAVLELDRNRRSGY